MSYVDPAVGAHEPRRWEADSARSEPAWRAVGSLAGPAGRTTTRAAWLLEHVTTSSGEDQLAARNFAQTVRRLDWDRVDDETRTSWLEWLAATDWSEALR